MCMYMIHIYKYISISIYKHMFLPKIKICIQYVKYILYITYYFNSLQHLLGLSPSHQSDHANILASNKPKSSCNFLGIKQTLEAPKFLSLDLIGVHQIATSTNDTTPQGFQLSEAGILNNMAKHRTTKWGRVPFQLAVQATHLKQNRQISQVDSFFVRDPGVKSKNCWKPAPSYSRRFL